MHLHHCSSSVVSLQKYEALKHEQSWSFQTLHFGIYPKLHTHIYTHTDTHVHKIHDTSSTCSKHPPPIW